MVPLVGELNEVLHRSLPNLSEAVQETLIERLLSSGLESREDLKYVKKICQTRGHCRFTACYSTEKTFGCIQTGFVCLLAI